MSRRSDRDSAPGAFLMIPKEVFDVPDGVFERILHEKNPNGLTGDELKLLVLVLAQGPFKKDDGKRNHGGVEGGRPCTYALVRLAFGWSDRKIKACLERLVRKEYLLREPLQRAPSGRLNAAVYYAGPAWPWPKREHREWLRSRASRPPARAQVGPHARANVGDAETTRHPCARTQAGDASVEWYKGRTRKRDRAEPPLSPNRDHPLARTQADLESATRGRGSAAPDLSESSPGPPSRPHDGEAP